jgi:sensor histidine kinase YesM
MYKKQLYKTALISAPIIALYGASPVFVMFSNFAMSVPNKPSFAEAWGLLTFITLLLWVINLYVISFFDRRKALNSLNRYLLSYGLVIAVTALAIPIAMLTDKKDDVPLIFPFLICIANNSIILIIANSIIAKSKQILADNEIAMLKISNMEAQQQQLIQQLQPHFLFNALSTLKSLIKNNAEQAEEYLIKLSDFLRYTVSSHNNKIVSLQEELTFTQDYIELQQIRFSDSIKFNLMIPENSIKQYHIPIYALQTLVENAIKHNAFTEEKPLSIDIVYIDGFIKVTNNKIPKAIILSSGVGLQNLNERYRLACGEEIVVENGMYVFSVTIKLI